MKNIFTALLILFLFSCKENGVQLGKPGTFVRYFNGGFPDVAQKVIKTSDGGYLILANTQTTATSTYYRIKLIKVDQYGNERWHSLIPDPADSLQPLPNYRGFGLMAIDSSGVDSGYLIVGDEIYSDAAANPPKAHGLLMVQVEPINGTPKKTVTKKYDSLNGAQVRGVGVARLSSGNFIVLGENLSQSSSGDMFYGEFKPTSTGFNKVWQQQYGVSNSLTQNVFVKGDSIYWSATNVPSGLTPKMRFEKSRLNTQPVDGGFYPEGGTDIFTCNDICQYGDQFGLVGSYGISSGAYNGIAFFRITTNGGRLDSAKFILNKTFAQSAQLAEAGNSITSCNNGFVILGTIGSDATESADTNYILIKIDKSGQEIWRKQYGGKFKDVGSHIIQADDGGFVVLGTTTLANVESIFLMKTDSEGRIE